MQFSITFAVSVGFSDQLASESSLLPCTEHEGHIGMLASMHDNLYKIIILC